MDRRPYGLSTRLYGPNNLTCQSSGVWTSPRGTRFADPLHGILSRHGATVYDYIYIYIYIIFIPANVVITESTLSRLEPAQCPHKLSNASSVIIIGSFSLVTVSGLIWLVVSDLIQLTVFDYIWLSFLIWLDSHLKCLFLIWVTSSECHFIPTSGSPALDTLY